jgi:hypothetical protein
VKPERALLPLAAIVLAVFATTRLMASIDPGEAHPTGLGVAADQLGTGDAKAGKRGGGGPSRETHSFYSPSGMRQLRALIRREGGPNALVPLFRVTPDQAQVQLAKGGGGRLLVIERGPKVKFSVSTPVAAPGGFRLRELDTGAPKRILAAVRRLSEASANDVDYMVFTVSPIDRTGGWDAFAARPPAHFHTDAHGRHVTRP